MTDRRDLEGRWQSSLDAVGVRETIVPMATLPRAALLGLLTLFVASAARAQLEPPSATSPPAAGAPPAATPPPAPPPTPPPAPPPPATAPITPLSPTLAPDPAPAPPLMLAERTAPEMQQPRPVPFYEKTWFWVATGAAVATIAIILLTVLASKDGPPDTKFGNMNAF
jgi:hypothetical protein